MKQKIDSLRVAWDNFKYNLKARVEYLRGEPVERFRSDFWRLLKEVWHYPTQKRQMDRYSAHISKMAAHEKAHGGNNMESGYIRAYIKEEYPPPQFGAWLYTDKDRAERDKDK